MQVKEVTKPSEEGLRRLNCQTKDGTVLTSADQRVVLSLIVLTFPTRKFRESEGQEKDVTGKMAHEPVVANTRVSVLSQTVY